jgi:hypothetical protein
MSSPAFLAARLPLAAAGLATSMVLTCGASPAHAEMLCGDRDQIVRELKKTWEEDLTATGLSNTGSVVEVFSSEEGTWTLLMTTPDGKTCLLGAGEHWEQSSHVALLGEPS